MNTKRNLTVVILATLFLAFLATIAGADVTVKGKVKSIDLETNTVVITTYDRHDITITISEDDKFSLKKLKEKRIKVGDDVKAKYVNKDGKNMATFFRLLAEC